MQNQGFLTERIKKSSQKPDKQYFLISGKGGINSFSFGNIN